MDKEIEELLTFYALDALTDEEREQVEEYLRKHPDARRQVNEMSQAAMALPEALTSIQPLSRTKDALMARVTVDARSRSSAQGQSRRNWLRFEPLLRTLTFAGAALVLVWVVELSLQVRQLNNELTSLGNALLTQSQSIEQINQKLTVSTPSTVITISLKGTTARPEARGELIVDLNSQSAVLVVSGLADLEPGKTYQVWLIDGSGPVSAGLLRVDSNGQSILIITSETPIGSFDSLGISVEPEGGSQQPTGDIVVLSDL